MPLAPPTYIVDTSGQQWSLAVNLAGTNLTDNKVSVLGAVPYININDTLGLRSWRLTIVPTPPPPGYQWGDPRIDQIPFSASYPNQILLNSPNGLVYALQVNAITQQLQISPSSAVIGAAGCNQTLAQIGGNVQDRLEEPQGSGIFWNLNYEIYVGLVEAMNDLMLLVGAPTMIVNTQLALNPNSVWQPMPKGIFAIQEIWGPAGQLRKVSLYDMDYTQSSWGSDWENDSDPNGPVRWAPVGSNYFLVHPAPSVAQTVAIDAIAYPYASPAFPPDGSTIIPFEHNFFEALEIYAAVYARVKEMGTEMQQGVSLYNSYTKLAQRMTAIVDKRDPLVFAPAFGAVFGLNPQVKR